MDLSTESRNLLSNFVDGMDPIFATHRGGVYWLSADIRILLRLTRVHPKAAQALANEFCFEVLRRAGPLATILVSAFNFEFPQTKIFDVVNSKVETGAFGSLLLQGHSQQRLRLPFYSYLVFGQKAEELLRRQIAHNTGRDSISEWMIEQRTRLLAVGHYYNNSFSTLHHAEDEVGVAYRYRKSFSGELVDADLRKPLTCTFLVRNLETCDGSSLTVEGDRHFRAKGIVQSRVLGPQSWPVGVYDVKLFDVHQELLSDLRSKKHLWLDYYGPTKPNKHVITKELGDRMYLDELRAFKAAFSVDSELTSP